MMRILLAGICAAVITAACATSSAIELTDGRFSTTFVRDSPVGAGFDRAELGDTVIDSTPSTIRYYVGVGLENPFGSPLRFRETDPIVFDSTRPSEFQISRLTEIRGPRGRVPETVFEYGLETQILGPLKGFEDTTSVLKASLTYHLLPSQSLDEGSVVHVTIWSEIDPDPVGGTSFDMARYDPATKTVLSTNLFNPLLFAGRATSDQIGTVDVYDVRQYDHGRFRSLKPAFNEEYAAPVDAELLTGIAFPEFPVGESRAVDFYYLFSTDLDHVPPQFATFVPEPTSIGMVMLGLAALVMVKRHRCRRES